VLWFSRLAAARYLDHKGGALAVLDQHDLTSQLWHLMRRGAPQAWVRLFAMVNGYLVERYERRVYPRFDVSVSVSETERSLTQQRVLKGASSPVLITAPNGVDIDTYTPADPKHQATIRDLVLIGTMNQRRNVDAAIYFATEIFPQLAAQFQSLRFVIVGKDPTGDVLNLGSLPGVLVTGAVPDVRPYLEGAEVVVAPFRFGSGVKHKVPIAMAMRKAIVSTPNGVQGLEVIHGEHLMIADTPADFAKCVATLLRDPELRAALGIRARQLAVERYSWDGIASALVAQVETIRLNRSGLIGSFSAFG
jgi:glycosyltransferase involved in cell wall biosynthesis